MMASRGLSPFFPVAIIYIHTNTKFGKIVFHLSSSLPNNRRKWMEQGLIYYFLTPYVHNLLLSGSYSLSYYLFQVLLIWKLVIYSITKSIKQNNTSHHTLAASFPSVAIENQFCVCVLCNNLDTFFLASSSL